MSDENVVRYDLVNIVSNPILACEMPRELTGPETSIVPALSFIILVQNIVEHVTFVTREKIIAQPIQCKSHIHH